MKNIMKNIINRFKYWFGIIMISEQISILDVRISKLQRKKGNSDKEIQKHKNQLLGIRDEFDRRMIKVNQALDRASGINKRFELSLEAAQEEIKIAKEITIPGLVAVLDTFKTSWDAQSSMDEMRKVAANSPQREIE